MCAFVGNLKSVHTLKNKLQKIPFAKYHANGNDFILVLDANFPKNLRVAEILSRLCSRHIGIGADGLFVLSPSDNYDFFLDYSDYRQGIRVRSAEPWHLAGCTGRGVRSSKKESLMQ